VGNLPLTNGHPVRVKNESVNFLIVALAHVKSDVIQGILGGVRIKTGGKEHSRSTRLTKEQSIGYKHERE